MWVINTEKVPIKIWAKEVEEGALKQARNLANLPFVFHHVALMPDAHQGYGMPIGGVLAALDVIIPNAVGVDIGCGMRVIKTNLTVEEIIEVIRKILNSIQRAIPIGFNHHKKKQKSEIFEWAPEITVIQKELESAHYQLGTLGGGNHFIEIQKDQEGIVWIMLHSGSRNFGKKVADYYNKIAIELNKKWNAPVPKEWQLGYIPLEIKEAQEYLRSMEYCLIFAKENRTQIMKVIKEIVLSFSSHCSFLEEIDIHHNYAVLEEHFGTQVMVHRKGAIKAMGKVIIPGSMGAPSYICQGLHPAESFLSCSHGAGRAMGRNEAKRKIPIEAVLAEMKEKGIELFKAKKADVAEECRQAYKDIDEVLSAQRDLVEIKVKLEPLGVVKG